MRRSKGRRVGVLFVKVYTIMNFNFLGSSSYSFNKILLIDSLIRS